MSVNTANAYGRITIAEEAIAQVAGYTALECYGIVNLISKKFSDDFADLLKKQRISKGVRVMTSGDRIFIDLQVVIKYGVSIDAVTTSLKKAVKYDVENFTGMVVDTINVNVMDVKV